MSFGQRPALVAICCALTLVLFFLPFFSSGGDLISGDLTDNRAHIGVLEHWRAWVLGQASLPDPNYFAPAKGVLGYSDTLALYVPVNLLSRGAGFDRYLSYQYTLVFVKLIGFLSFYAFLRRILRCSSAASLYGAALFTLSSMYFTSLGHGQLASVAFLPLVALFAAQAWLTRESRLASSALSGSAAMLYGLLFLTAHYTAFFFALATTTVLAIYAALDLWRDPSGVLKALAELRRSFIPQIAVASLVFGASLTPFAIIYLPVLRQTGGRAFPDVDTQILGTIQILSPGPSNPVWGAILQQFPDLFQLQVPREIGRGWAPFTFVVFVLAASSCIQRGIRRNSTTAQRFLAAACLSVFVLALSATRIGGLLPWRLIFEFFPGARGVRVPGRINLVLNLVVVTFVVDYLRSRFCGTGAQFDLGRKIKLAGICAILLIEQLNWDAFPGYSRRDELALFHRVSTPPSQCRAFYVSRSSRPDSESRHIDAMLLARQFNLPTINGYSGLEPPGWRCPNDVKACEESLLQWASSHGLTDGLCALDMSSGQWSGPPASRPFSGY